MNRPPSGAGISIGGLSKRFRRPDGTIVKAVDDVDLHVQPGELLVLLGPSGCGKTTLLRLIAGLEEADAGRIEIDGTVVLDTQRGINVATARRPLNMVFQSYALWPHMTATANVAYPLRNRGVASDTAAQRARETLEMVGVGAVADQYPGEMSGGQQQRVALARAVVAGDSTILFDEPLSNVDAKVRERLRLEIMVMQRELGFTALYVTHDQEEAMKLGTRIAVLREGQIAQLGSPREVYDRPASLYVANFIGTVNEFSGTVVARDAGQATVQTEVGTFLAESCEVSADEVAVLVRPEAWTVSQSGDGDEINTVRGIVEGSLYLGGSRVEYIVHVGDHRFVCWVHGGAVLGSGEQVCVRVDPDDVSVFEQG